MNNSRAHILRTDPNWFYFLKSITPTGEVNFWRKDTKSINNIHKNDRIYFLRKKTKQYPKIAIIGIGIFGRYMTSTLNDAWLTFGKNNGCNSLNDLVSQFNSTPLQTIGCLILNDIIFFENPIYLSDVNIPFPSKIQSRKTISPSEENDILNLINGYEYNKIIDSPTPKPKPIIKNNGTKTWPRNESIANNSIIHSNYKCSFDNNHVSFTSNTTKKPYMEPHHLIPLSQQDRFSLSLDVEANIVSLCSNCHNCVHYGIYEERLLILKQLYDCRKDRLAKCGINITLSELLNIYNVPKKL